MAIDLEPRQSSKQADAALQRQFTALCARIQRSDLAAHLVILLLVVTFYALVVGWFDWFAADAGYVPIVRGTLLGVFLAALAIGLVQTVRCFFRRVNPYFVAHQLERTLPEAKNSLINWLDLHDEGLPSAFQRNLSSRAADDFAAMDAEQTLPRRRNRALLILLAPPALGLLVLLLLGPGAFLGSMLRAFVPFYTPPEIPRTRITIIEPVGGDAEIGVNQAVNFAAKIEGHVPASHRPDAPRLLYRYQTNEDYFTLPLQADGGVWSGQLLSGQVRTGFSYKVAAGSAETPEYQVRVRGPAHIEKFVASYQNRPYLKLAKKTVEFPNKAAATPTIHGLRGAEVELTLHASRPVKKASVEVLGVNVPVRITDDPAVFACRFTLDKSGSFRVRFTTLDGEENVDRGEYPIDVRADEAPTVVLTSPAKDVAVAENGTLAIEGRASDDIGVKSLALHVRVLTGSHKPKLQPIAYRPGKSFQFEDGTYPDAIDYQEVLALDELKDDKGTLQLLPAGTVLEYWLQATDNADYPTPAGNVGKSAAFKITLLPRPKDKAKSAADRQIARQWQAMNQKRQDDRLKQQQQGRGQDPKGNGSQGNGQQPDDKQLAQDKDKINQALGGSGQQPKPGESKGADSPKSDKKDGPADAKSDQQPNAKPNDPKSSDNGNKGQKKDEGNGNKGNAESKDGGDKKKQDDGGKGERKEGGGSGQGEAKNSGDKGQPGPQGQAKDSGPMGMNQPAPAQPKEQPGEGDGPMAQAKPPPADPGDSQAKGAGKGAEANGPDVNAKDTPAGQPPMQQSKAGAPPEAEPKAGPPEQAKNAGQPRGNEEGKGDSDPSWDRLKDLVDKLAKKADADQAGELLAAIAKNADDPQKRDLAKDILGANGRDPDTGKEKKKAPNPFGSNGQTAGISDEIKADAANREFVRRIGQLQLEAWKKRVTPDLLKKAGMSDADWQRFVKNMQAYDALVQKRNAEILRSRVQELRGRGTTGVGVRTVEGTPNASDPFEVRTPPPPELRDVRRRFSTNP